MIAAAASHNAERLWQIACHLASSMLDTICMSGTQKNFGRGEITTFSCVHVVPDMPSPCKDQMLARVVKNS